MWCYKGTKNRIFSQNSVLYIGHNIYLFTLRVMKEYVLDPLSAAHALTALVLKKADLAFYRMRRTKEREYHLANGTISGV